MKKFLITLLLITLVAFICSRGSTIDPRPQPTDDLERTAAKLDRVLSELETLVAIRVQIQRQHNFTLRKLTTRGQSDDSLKADRTGSTVRRSDDPGR